MLNFVTSALMFLLVVFVGAVFYRVAVKVVAKFALSFGRAMLLALVVGVIHKVLGFGLGLPFGSSHEVADQVGLFATIGTFFIASLIHAKFIVHPETGPVGFKKGMLISLMLFAIMCVLSIVLLVVFLPFMR